MFKFIKNLFHINNSCNKVCPHCEVEIAEKTASSIIKMIDIRLSSDLPKEIKQELKYQQASIRAGYWYSIYDSIK